MAIYTKELEEGNKFLYEENNIRYYKNNTWINVLNIPRTKKGFFDWKKCKNIILPFHCIDIDGIIIIEFSYKTKSGWELKLKCGENSFDVNAHYLFYNSGIQNIVFKYGVFIFSINQIIQDNKYNIIIIDRKYEKRTYKNRKEEHVHMYKIHCNNCGNEYWTTLYQLEYGSGCQFCTGHMHGKVIEGYNDIPTTDPWMIPYFQGDEDEAKLYSHGSRKKIYPKCPYCNEVSKKSYKISTIYRQHGFSCKCNDKMFYPEKIMTSVLDQLNLNYKSHVGCGTLPWSKGVIYDFYIEDKSCIIETHGWQHYERTTFSYKGGRTLEEEIKNDIFKEDLAKNNNIKNYIVIDCRLSDLNYIKKSIINSELPNLFNFKEKDIDWEQCEKFALNNLTIDVCNYYNNVSNNLDDLCNHFNKELTFIKNALLRGKRSGLCDFKIYANKALVNCKPIKCLENGKEYLSAQYCSKISESEFGKKILATEICDSAKNNKSRKGYHFVYINKDDYFTRHNLYK